MSLQLLTLATAAGGFALVGLIYNTDAGYFMCTALVAVIVVAFITSHLSARALVWRREVADRVFENEAFTVTLHVTNRGRIPLFFLYVSDAMPEHVSAVEAPHFVLVALWPREQATLTYRARAAKRGVFPLGPLRVTVSDPFGVFQRAHPVALPGHAVVLPRPMPLLADREQRGLDLRGLVSGDLSRASDSDLEFYGIRDYQPGDELRRIHWPATAHHAKITVIEYERGTSGSLLVVLDTLLGGEFGAGVNTTLEVGVKIAASLVHWALENDGSACLAFGGAEEARWEQADAGARERLLLEALAWAKADSHLSVSAVAEWAAPRAPSGSAVAFVTAAPDASLPAVVQWLTDENAAVLVFSLDPGSFGGPRVFDEAMEGRLRAAGARVAVYRRGLDLREYLLHALLDYH